MQSSPATTTRCQSCARAIEPTWPFCAACGADNRPPELRRRQPSQHSHDFRFGTHCIVCGHLARLSAATGQAIVHGYDFSRTWQYRASGILFLALGVFFSVQFGFFTTTARSHQGAPIFALVCFLLGIGSMFYLSQTTIDIDRNEVAWVEGLLPFVRRATLPLNEFQGLELYMTYSGRNRNYRLCLLHSSGRRIKIDESCYSLRMEREGASLSAALNLPFNVERSGFSRLLGF